MVREMPAYDNVAGEDYDETETSQRASGPRRWAGALAAAVLVAGAVSAACWRGMAAPGGGAPLGGGGADAFLAKEERGASAPGGCGFGENCASSGCCKAEGFDCVKESQWWSACKSTGSADTNTDEGQGGQDNSGDEEEQGEQEETGSQDCSAGGEDCTKSKCCSSNDYKCTKRSDGMWWKSTCTKAPSSSDAEQQPSNGGGGGGDAGAASELHAEECGKDMPDDVHKAWEVAEQCSKKLLAKMSQDDKLSLLHGSPGGLGFAGYIRVKGAVGKNGTVRLTMNDGPQGYNGYTEPTFGKGTQYPDLIALAASFDTETAGLYGAAIAEEFRTKGCAVLLGPDVEVVRNQLSGRTFESLSGEDPYLGSQLAYAYVHQVHKRGVIATAKHWLDNNQEKNRQQVDVDVSDRAQHEIYMQPFEGAIDAGAGAVMCSYNKVYGEYACENSKLLRQLLRKDLGFKGFVVSDWGAVHSGAKSAKSGLNVEMPEPQYYGSLGSSVHKEVVDELAGQVLSAIYVSGQFHGRGPPIDFSWPPPYYNDASSEQHRQVAKRVITEGSVLLKNSDSALPLRVKGLKILLVGKPCKESKDPAYGQGSMFSAGGSGYAETPKVITPLDGLRKEVGGAAEVSWSNDGAGAGDADVTVICAAAHEEEGKDRKDLTLPKAEELIKAVKDHGAKQIILVGIVPGAVTTEWIDDVDAALMMFMPGEQVGAAFADLLTGKSNPNGRLPVSFPAVGEERFSKEQYPGVDLLSKFSEGVLVGYRWNDAKGVPSAFPFGFGLTYTDFKFSEPKAVCNGRSAEVSVTIENVGRRTGAAVPQLYVSFDSLKPVVRQLRGFKKVRIPHEGKLLVNFELGVKDWSFYDEKAQKWVSALEKGEAVKVSLGTSSTDLIWTSELACDKSATINLQQ